MNVEKKEAGSSCEQRATGKEREKEVLKKLDMPNEETAAAAKIRKVPPILRQDNLKEYYMPREIFIGPYNHKAENFPQEIKIKLTKMFLEESRQEKEDLYKKIKDNIEQLKKSFLDPNHGDEELALILFVDGCSILQFIYSYAMDNLDYLGINHHIAALIQQDIFLLENQLPFEALEMLYEKATNRGILKASITAFVRLNIMAPLDYSTQLSDIDMEFKKPAHLLELLQLTLLQKIPAESSTLKIPNPNTSLYKRSFRNIQDLRAAWIRLEPSESCALGAVSFSSSLVLGGCLKLPAMIMDDSTLRKLFNLVAFEMCPEADHGVTSYLYFLDSLIDNEEDAKELRTAMIFRNRLSSDADVSNFFNQLGRQLLPAPAYVDVKIRIQRHYDNRWMTWTAQVLRDHLRSPWTILALVAALMILLMTTIQTWFVIHPQKS